MTVLVAIDGVLRDESGQPLPDGEMLVRTLCEHYRVVLCSDGSAKKAEHYLRSRGFVGHAQVLGDEVGLPDYDLRARQIEVVRADGRVEMLIDADVVRVAAAVQVGVTGVGYVRPAASQPDWRMDTPRTLRAWDDLSREMERRAEIRGRMREREREDA